MIMNDMYNHGRDGLKTQFTVFMADHNAREDERKKSDERFRWAIGVILTILTIALAALGVLEGNRQMHEGKLFTGHLNQQYANSKHQTSLNIN